MSDAGDTALALYLVLERDGTATERRQVDRPRHEPALVERARRDLRDPLAARVIVVAEQIGIGRGGRDLDLLDLGDRGALGDDDLAALPAEVREPHRAPHGPHVPAAEQARLVAVAGLGAMDADVG